MAARSRECDTNRLRFSLEDRLSAADQAELAEHLENCGFCRAELERLAAASQFWGDARLLGEEPKPDPSPTAGLAPISLETDGEVDENDAGIAWLRLLDPPDPGQHDTLGRLGSYEILQVLGQGGMGVVLKARDPALDRTVAIKVLTPALAHAATARRRFTREARAAAAVAHEHIVAIHAVDEFQGLSYLVMQYIPGRSLQERLDASGPLEVKEILRIGTQAARALAAAHAQGVVHRDIKPANILLENCVERVKLTDFGLARAVDDASLTQSGIIAGTPQYMAPEQARGEPVDARADLFSLGAVLYAMAAGRPPFRADSAMAVLKRVCDDRHHAVRELNADIPDWLEFVIDRLLAKEPADRFQTATEVGEVLERGLAHLQQPTIVPRPFVSRVGSAVRTENAVVPRPIIVPPDNLVGSAVRTENAEAVRRADPTVAAKMRSRRRRLAMAAGLLLLVLAGLGASEASGLTQVTEFVATVLRIKTPEGTLVVNVDDPSVKVDIDDETVIIGGAGPQEIRLRIGKHHIQATRNGQPVKDEMVSIMKGKKEIVTIGFEPKVAAGTPEREARQPMAAPPSHLQQCMICHQAPVHVDQPWPANHPPLSPGTWYVRNRDALHLSPGSMEYPTRAMVWSLAFSPDGRRLAIGQQGIDDKPSPMRIWDLAEKRDIIWLLHPAAYRSVAYSPDGRMVATGTLDGNLGMYRITGDVANPDYVVGTNSPINALEFLPHGNIIVTGLWDGSVKFWAAATGQVIRTVTYPGKVFTLAVNPDGWTLAVAGEMGTIDLYNAATGRIKLSLRGHDLPVESVAFSLDGKHLASASWDKTVRVWDVKSGREERRIAHSTYERSAVRFSPDGKTLACSDGQHEARHSESFPASVQLWDWAEGTLRHVLNGHHNSIYALAFSPDGKTLASGSMDQTVKFWDVATGTLRETIVPGESGPRGDSESPNPFGPRR